MDDNEQKPLMFDDVINDQDPQSAMAGKGLQQLGSTIGPPIVRGTVKGLSGLAKALDVLRGTTTGPALGSVLEKVTGKPVYSGQDVANAVNPTNLQKFPSAAEMYQRAGVPEGAKISDYLSMYADPNKPHDWYQPEKGGLLDWTLRGTGGTATDIAIDPLTWLTMGAGGAAKKALASDATAQGLEAAAKGASPGAKVLEMVSEAAPKGIEMGPVKQADLHDFIKNNNFSIFTAENPNAKQATPEFNAKILNKLKNELAEKNIDFIIVKGHYGQPETSVLIPHTENITPNVVDQLAAKYGQESAAHKLGDINELHYVTGNKTGTVSRGSGYKINPEAEDYYTDIGGHKVQLDVFGKGETPGSLVHYSRSENPLDTIDPKFYGTGAKGEERKRVGLIPRSYYYESNTIPEMDVVSGSKTVHKIDRPENIIDLASEAARPYINKAFAEHEARNEALNAMEAELRNAGYSGYKDSSGALPNAVALFHPQKVKEGSKITPQHYQEINELRKKPRYAVGGIVTTGNPKLQQAYKQHFAEGGEAQPFDQAVQPENLSLSDQPQAAPVQSFEETIQPENLYIGPTDLEKKYGGMRNTMLAGLSGAATGLAGPLATEAMVKSGLTTPEEQLGLRAVHPLVFHGGEAAGLIIPAIVSGGESVAARTALGEAASNLAKFTQAGAIEAAAKAILPKAGETLAGKIGTAAAKGAIENMLIAGSDEASRMILQDPNQSAGLAVITVGLSGILGGALGGAIGSIAPLAKGAGSKLGKVAADFKGRVLQHVNNPDPVASMTQEMGDYFGQVNKIGSEIYGETGLKSEAIAKAMPELNQGMRDQVSKVVDSLSEGINKLKSKGDQNYGILEDKLESFVAKVNQDNPATMFEAIQNLKKELQAESRYTEGLSPLAERAYRTTVKELAHTLRTLLENTAVWGKAGELQGEINGAFSNWLKATKDFRGLMTTKVMDESQINPAKVSTYLNQLGKPQAEIKTTMLQNFLDATEKLKASVGKAYDTLGVENPMQEVPLNVTLNSLEKRTLGGKLADAFIDKALTDAGGKGIGGIIGATAAPTIGLSYEIGALLGAGALGPFFSSILPSIAKSIVSKDPSSDGLKAAVDYAAAVVKGENLLGNAAKNIFKAEREVLPEAIRPNDKTRAKLDKQLLKLQENPSTMLPESSPNAHYLPEHASSVAENTSGAVSFLNSIRPTEHKNAPLDSTPSINSVAKAKFNNALDIAQQPLIVVDKLKKGTLTAEDVKILQTTHPAVYARLQNRLQQEMIEHVNKGNVIPYKTRVGLSLFTGQPLDSTVMPGSIQAAQIQRPAQQPQQQGQQPTKGVKSSPALQKMPNLYETSAQAKEEHRGRR